jgi:peptidoglycan/LPS O-acetylase OafA/YrhL
VRPGRPSNVAILSAVIDVVLVLAFVLIGRASHGEGALGTLNTVWPFLVGLVVGWLLARAWRRPRRIAWTGIIVWVSTVIVGMLLRLASGQGVELSFVVVATIVLAVFLVGWRAIALLVVKVLAG